MKPSRPSVQQKRLEAILEQYRDKEARPAAERHHLLRLWREFIFPLRWRLLFAIAMTLVYSQERYVWGFMTMVVLDHILLVKQNVGMSVALADIPRHQFWILLLFFANCSFHLLVVATSWLATYQITFIGQRVVFELRKELHVRLQSLPLSFFDHMQTGRLLSVVVDDVGTIQQSIGGLAVNFIAQVAAILIGMTVLCLLNYKLALLIFLALPFYVVNFRHFRPRIREANITHRRANTALYNKVEERITAVRTIKVFGRERTEARTFAEAANNLARLMMLIVRLGTKQNIIASIISATTLFIILYFSFQACQNGMMTVGQVIYFYGAASFIFQPAVALNDLIAMEFPRVSVVLRRVFDLMEAEPEPPDRPDAVALQAARGDINFEKVTFTYPGDETPTLREISFHVPAGKQVAIMGPSGAGKSSLLYLLMRFYDPDDGAVALDGRDLRDVKLLSLRDRITLVMQEPVIFSGTVAENIRYGHLNADDAAVRRAAKDADLHEFIMSLPDSYETVVGERGMSLSGGQRQRLALAASLLSRPSVLLLDDTTSALDPVTEARIRATLNRIMRGRTSFLVTHRISTAMASDLVLVLEEGRVTQFGTPAELLTQEGLFRRVYEQQTRESADVA